MPFSAFSAVQHKRGPRATKFRSPGVNMEKSSACSSTSSSSSSVLPIGRCPQMVAAASHARPMDLRVAAARSPTHMAAPDVIEATRIALLHHHCAMMPLTAAAASGIFTQYDVRNS